MLGQRKSVILGGVLAAAVAAGGAPAFAESASCHFVATSHASSSCSTASVAANGSGHFVFVSITPSVHWIVRDNVSQVIVGSGTSGLLGTRRTITGLFARYVLTIDGSIAGNGTINNN